VTDMLLGKVAIVTGGGNGIGRAIAARYGAEGAVVAILDIDEPAGKAAAAAIEAAGARSIFVRADLTSPPDITRAVVDLVDQVGPVDVLCNNAGIMDGLRPPLAVTLDLWERVMAVNATAPLLLCQEVLPGMIAAGGGSIVNIASVAGLTGGRAGTAYTASKHALVGLTRSIAFTHLDDGIRCNAICPGGITTDIGSRDVQRDDFGAERYRLTHSSKPRHGDPDEIAKVASFLASDLASFVNGVVMPVDGGWMAA